MRRLHHPDVAQIIFSAHTLKLSGANIVGRDVHTHYGVIFKQPVQLSYQRNKKAAHNKQPAVSAINIVHYYKFQKNTVSMTDKYEYNHIQTAKLVPFVVYVRLRSINLMVHKQVMGGANLFVCEKQFAAMKTAPIHRLYRRTRVEIG